MSTKLTALLAAGGMALVATPFAVAAGEGRPLLGGQRNPSPNPAQALTRETEVIADTSTYGTRQSNKSNNGGGAIYGCRSLEGGTPADREPCIRANNLSRGLSFEFETDGAVAGTITTAGGEATRPFTTNATGVATGLNADRVDGRGADDLLREAADARAAAHPFAAVAADGRLEAGRAATGAARSAEGVVAVDFGRAVRTCAQQVTTRGGQPRTATVEQVDDDTLRVRTFAVAGATAGEPADAAFHLTVTC
jgi:hypothetical protein